MDMNDNNNVTTAPVIVSCKMTMNSGSHMTFCWGHATDIFISGWPGDSTTMYIIALITIFHISMLVEWQSYARLIKPGLNDVTAGVIQTLMHGTKIGLTYLVMLAVMSLNVGVFIVTVAGYATGFLIFGSRVFKKSVQIGDSGTGQKSADLPPSTC